MCNNCSDKFALQKGRALIAFSAGMMLFTIGLYAQTPEVDEWNVPWIIVGDSTVNTGRESKLVLTGTITEVKSNRPVSGALISADFLKHYDYSDDNGNYVLEVPPGTYKIKVKQLGMLPVYLRVKVVSNGMLNVTMKEGVVELSEVLVTSRPVDSNVKGPVPGLTRLSVQEVKTLPALTGEVDILKSLQLMPGVSSVGEGTSALNIRGGRVDQNLVLFNDVPLFNTSHALGFVSAFNQDVIDNFSLYKGNVPAQLGGRASSVIEINTRRGDLDNWKFQGGVGPLASRLTVEGPLVKKKTGLLLAGRVSHANWVLREVSDPDVNNSRVSFNDVFAGITQRFSENSAADVTFYSSNDSFMFSDLFGYKWNNYLLNARWQTRADEKLSPLMSLSYGHFKNALFEPEGIEASEITNTMDYFHLKETLHYIPANGHEIKAGFDAIGYFPRDEQKSGYNGNPSVLPRKAGKSTGLEWAIFVNDEFEWKKNISISAGIRYSKYHHLGPDTTYQYGDGRPSLSGIIDTTSYPDVSTIKSFAGLEPRFSVRIGLRKNQSVKASYNRMRQYIHLISNTTAPTPIDLWQVSTAYLPPQLADNYSLGYFLNMKDNLWETSFEVFYKNMKNLIEYRDFAELFVNDHLETELISGKGRAYGAEAFIRKLKGRWTGWFVYMLSPTDFPDPFGSVPPSCYIDQQVDPQRIVLFSTEGIKTATIPHLLVASRLVDATFKERHYFTTFQSSLTREAHEYWRKIDIVANQAGSIFDAPPARVKGNIVNMNNPEEEVHGYFQAVNQKWTRFYLLPAHLPFYLNEHCEYRPDRPYLDYPSECLNCLSVRNSSYKRPPWF